MAIFNRFHHKEAPVLDKNILAEAIEYAKLYDYLKKEQTFLLKCFNSPNNSYTTAADLV